MRWSSRCSQGDISRRIPRTSTPDTIASKCIDSYIEKQQKEYATSFSSKEDQKDDEEDEDDDPEISEKNDERGGENVREMLRGRTAHASFGVLRWNRDVWIISNVPF